MERCASEVAARVRRTDEPPERVAARAALAGNLSQASVYRMASILGKDGMILRPSGVIREMERIKRGIY